jgi:hypothetical protein
MADEPSAKKAKASASADASKAGDKLDAKAQAADKAKDSNNTNADDGRAFDRFPLTSR